MSIFSQKLDNFLGIDIGGQLIKVVELSNYNGRPKLYTYGIAERKNIISKGDKQEENLEETALIIKALCKQAKVSSDRVVTALPSFDVFSSILSIPEVGQKDLGSAVLWEAKKLLPMPLEEMIIDWQVLNIANPEAVAGAVKNEEKVKERSILKIKKKEEKHLKVLLTAAPKPLSLKYINIFKHAGLNLLSLETETVAMVRSLLGNDKSLALIVDVGAVNTNIAVVDQGIPILNRGVDVGGVNVTRVFEQILNIPFETAEQFKRDLANFMAGGAGSAEIPKDIELALSPIINEIRYIVSLLQTQGTEMTLALHENGRLEKIILTGGSAWLPYFADHLVKNFDVPTYIGDPWARVIYPEDLKPILEDIGPKFAIAIGLAMREILK
ncbi:MAG: pilus assembly protein PilM [Parcubacteria group bacterium]|nr:pilus assembly protein PilM [Parcubacteria group bacterium]